MGQSVTDKTGTEVLEPIVLNPKTVNTYKDNTLLTNNELEVASNVIFDDGVIEKVPGTTLGNSDTPGAAVMGLHRAYGRGTEKVCLRLANGTLKSGPATFATTVLSSLTTTKRTPFVNVKGKAWGVNEENGPIRYDPQTVTGLLANIVSPYLRKKIAFFESDETWSTAGGGAISHAVFRGEEWSGNAISSLLLTPAASGNENSYREVKLDLSQFANTKASNDEDTISFYTFHDIWNNIDYLTVEFSTVDSTFATKYMATIYQEKFEQLDFEWTPFDVKKGAFVATGAADWSDVQAVRFTAYANANGALKMYIDFVHLKCAKPIAKPINKSIFTCESNTGETWSDDATLQSVEVKEGHRSVRLAPGETLATCTLTTPLNLAIWVDNSTSEVTDELVFDIRSNDISKITDANCLKLHIGADNGNYWTYTWADKDTLGLTGSHQWIEIRVKKDDVDAAVGAGAPAWTSIAWIRFEVAGIAAGGYFYIDNMRMEPYQDYLQIADFEDDETWTITGDGEMSTDKNGVTEGVQCLKLWSSTPKAMSDSTAVYDCAVMNLTQFEDTTASTTGDYITFDLYVKNKTQVEYIELWFDNNSLATFVDAYKYRLTNALFPGQPTKLSMRQKLQRKDDCGGEVRIKKSDFEEISSAGGGAWSTIGAIKFVVRAKAGRGISKKSGEVFIDNLMMKRKAGITGRYYYKYCFVVQDIPSGLSEMSEYVDSKSSKILIQNIKTSADTRVTSRWVFRLGGGYPETWMLVKEIGDNTTETFLDDIEDENLPISMGEDIPQGPIDPTNGGILANNLIYNPETDTMLYWGDPTYKNRVYESHPGYYHAVDANGYREFADHVMSVIPWYGQIIILYKNKIQKIAGSLMTGDLVDVPGNFGACSYWAAKSFRSGIIVAGLDNVYLFDGYKAIAVGDEVKGYFKGRETYLSTVNVGFNKDTIYIACKDKTGTPTYNDTVLRFYIPGKSWAIEPDWNVNVWSNWDSSDDNNELYYGDSVTGNIYSINSATYRFNTTAISSEIETGWMNFPDTEMSIKQIELKAKGTASSSLVFKGYKNLSGAASATGTITLTTSWVTYRIGPKNIHNILKGDNLKIEFTHATDNAYFKAKDIVLYVEKLPKRITLNEVTIT